MNKVILSGNLCKDVQLAQTQAGKEYLTNCIAVQRDFKNANGEYESDFINFVVWGGAAAYLAKYAKKGDMVELIGRWKVENYTDQNGNKQTANKCEVEQVKVVFSRQKEEKEEKPALTPTNDTGLPF